MKTKIIPFDLETAKKIQDGKIEGRIRTKEGNLKARVICFDKVKHVRGDGTIETHKEDCVLYEGNEHLVGTTDKPKED